MIINLLPIILIVFAEKSVVLTGHLIETVMHCSDAVNGVEDRLGFFNALTSFRELGVRSVHEKNHPDC